MEFFIAYCNQTQGRDKVYRITQYGSKLLAWHLQQHGQDENTINRILQLEKSMSTSRKLFRFGQSAQSFRAAQRAINLQDYILRITLTVSHTNKAMYLLLDHYIWLGRAGLIQIDVKRWNTLAYKFWLGSLVMTLLRDLYALYVDMGRFLQNAKYENESERSKTKINPSVIFTVMKKNPQAAIDLIKTTFDIVIPMSSLGYLRVNNGVVGACGLISSIIAALQIAKPSLKLKP